MPVLCLLWLPGCGLETAATRGTFRVALQDDPHSLDPAVGYDVPTWSLEHLLFESLVTFGNDQHIEPALASSWRQPDPRTYVFTLKRAHFHDGRPVRSRDVVASLNRLLAPSTRSPGATFYTGIEGADACLTGKALAATGISAPDDRTVRIVLKTPDPIFLHKLAMPFASVLPEDVAAKDAQRKPVGTGPFRLLSWRRGEKMVFVRHSPPPASPPPTRLPAPIQRVEVGLGVHENIEVLKFERGELDVIGALRNIPAADFVRLSQQTPAGCRMFRGNDAAVQYVTINAEMPPFDRREVRRAIAQAIDKQRIVQLVNGRGTPAAGILPPGIPGYDPDFRGLSHDPAESRRALVKAGYPSGFAVTYGCVANDTQRKVAQAIQQDLARIGVNVTIKPMAFPTYLQAKSTRGQVQIGSGNWSQDYPDPSNFLVTLYHSKNIREVDSLNDSFYRNPEVDRLFDLAERTASPRARWESFRRAEALIIEDAPVVPLYHPIKCHLTGPRVRGYGLHPVWGLDLTGVELN
ncbi:MAG: ABC transporter substrate-binding protein [Candidatus Sericytochromatia bacterium]|nr:ABC transporter substrate-binding protein [Candidatus Sericytochromatia bacterium]